MQDVRAIENFRANLAVAMKDRKLSQRGLAGKAKMSYPYVNRILRGLVTPSIKVCDDIADAVGIPLRSFLESPREFKRNGLTTVSR